MFRLTVISSGLRSALLWLCFGGAIVAGCSLPRESSSSRGVDSLRVMTYNIHHGADAEGRIDVERIARVIGDSQADIVALQEVDRGVERSQRLDLMRELSALTGLEHTAFGKNLNFQGGAYGNALLSRYPVTSFTNHPLEQLSPHEQRGVLEVKIEVAGRPLTVLVMHLDHQNESERLHSLEQIEAMIAPEQPVILAGDLNDDPTSEVYERATALLMDAWTGAGDGQGHTFPSSSPDRRIDYVFHSRHLRTTSAYVPATEASDHRPVVVTFTMR